MKYLSGKWKKYFSLLGKEKAASPCLTLIVSPLGSLMLLGNDNSSKQILFATYCFPDSNVLVGLSL